MRWMDLEQRPGKVLQVVDNYGAVKASCAGLFSEEDDPTMLPPVYPWPTASRMAFTAPHEGDLINVIFDISNPRCLYYTYQRDFNDNSSTLDNSYKDVEIMMKRTDPVDRSKVTMEATYNSDDGFKISNGGDNASEFHIDNNGDHDIHLKHSTGTTVSVSKDRISLGSDGESQYKGVLGEPLCDALSKICDTLETILNSCTTPQTAPLKAAMAQLSMAKAAIQKEKVLSNKVTLDK